jgi:hypothetical protein
MTSWVLLSICLLAQPPSGADARNDRLRNIYRQEAEKYAFHLDAEQQRPLTLVEAPIQRWSQDDDWSGDVFLWIDARRPVVLGCILSSPVGSANRNVYHEFHLVSEQPIAPADLRTRRRWSPQEGLARRRIPDAPQPAANAAVRLTQMRNIARRFTAHMEADGQWRLRLLPQPLYRYGEAEGSVADGALFAYVWTRGTDPEFMLLLECSEAAVGPAWNYVLLRFTHRALWLRDGERELWRVASHQEPGGAETEGVYTTAYASTLQNRLLEAEDE